MPGLLTGYDDLAQQCDSLINGSSFCENILRLDSARMTRNSQLRTSLQRNLRQYSPKASRKGRKFMMLESRLSSHEPFFLRGPPVGSKSAVTAMEVLECFLCGETSSISTVLRLFSGISRTTALTGRMML